MIEFLSIAWPGLLAFAGLCAFVAHGIRDNRRTQLRGRYRAVPAVPAVPSVPLSQTKDHR